MVAGFEIWKSEDSERNTIICTTRQSFSFT
jgi:hypothetical protein